MEVNWQRDSGQPLNRFSRLGTLYIVALSAIALVAITGQVLIQYHLNRQLTDSEVVNIAGRQRMLSQKISKCALQLTSAHDTVQARVLSEMKESVALWKASQNALIHGSDDLGIPGDNTEEIRLLFGNVEAHYNAILTNAQLVIDGGPNLSPEAAELQIILAHEPMFLHGMNLIVEQYAREAHDRVSALSVMEYILVGVSLLVILLEIAFVFRPTALQVAQTVSRLTDSEKNAQNLSKEIGALYASLEKSYRQIAAINQPAENPRLLAKADRGGNITFVGERYKSLVQHNDTSSFERFSDLFPTIRDAGEWMDEVIERVSDGNSWRGEAVCIDAARGEHWVDVIITPVFGEDGEIAELVMVGSEITHHKLAERSMSEKNMAQIEKTINQQKFRSVLILEGQEEERKRIAMDIHDGIGQMLTSLKFQIESINVKNEGAASAKIAEVEALIKDVIKEVRKVTFNLKPTVLGDYGLQAGLNVFITEIGKLVSIPMVLHTGEEIERLPQKIENNIFRIIQEAINNSIKYSQATRIDVHLGQSDGGLVAIVRDDGQGFDTGIIESRSVNIESGRGFFNMYERTEYVNGKLEITSAPGKGTTVQLTVPLHHTVQTG
jgi:two-component system sensor histidine kinase DegS